MIGLVIKDIPYTDWLKIFRKYDTRGVMTQGLWGFEKENIRTVVDTGEITLTSHPAALGSKDVNPEITTDFSESQVEMVTPPFSAIKESLNALERIQDTVNRSLKNLEKPEFLWPMSMPPILCEETKIPIAQFQDRKKTEYREYLAGIYGRKMQTICGIHYNFSFPKEFWDFIRNQVGVHHNTPRGTADLKSDGYFKLARNVLRDRWLLTYLFGAAPAFHPSYSAEPLQGIPTEGKDAISIRLSPIGYSAENTRIPEISMNSLEEHILDIQQAIQSGRISGESENYSAVRFKAAGLKKGETHMQQMKENGVGYIEFRSVDLNPFYKLGVSEAQIHFLHLFMVYSLFRSSGPLLATEKAWIRENDARVALKGLQPNLRLKNLRYLQSSSTMAEAVTPGICKQAYVNTVDEEVPLRKLATEILKEMTSLAQLMDEKMMLKDPANRLSKETPSPYQSALKLQMEKVKHPELLPAAQVLREISRQKETDRFISFGLRLGKRHAMHQNLSAPKRPFSIQKTMRDRLSALKAIKPANCFGPCLIK